MPLTEEELKEDIVISAIMAGIAFITTFVGMLVRKYVRERIE